MSASRTQPLLELASALTLLAVDLWWLRTFPSKLPSVLAQVLVLGIFLSSLARRRRRPLRSAPIVSQSRAWMEAGLGTSIILTALLLIGHFIRTEVFDEVRLFSLGWGPIDQIGTVLSAFAKAGMQQLVLLGFLWPLSREVFGRPAVAALVSAGIFGAAHLPNPTFAISTGLAAAFWLALYRRGRSFAAVVASHMAIAACAYAVLPERTLEDLHVGAKALSRAPNYRMLEAAHVRDALGLACSKSFVVKSKSSEEYVARIFPIILGREVNQSEIAEWTERAEHLSRCTAAKMLAMSDESIRLSERTGAPVQTN